MTGRADALTSSTEAIRAALSLSSPERPPCDVAPADERIIDMDVRALTRREREVLEALLAVDFPGAEAQRLQAAGVVVVGGCACGCPSIDFRHGPGRGMTIRVNANIPGSYDSLFLYTIEDPEQGHVLGGIEWAGIETNPAEFPSPELLEIQPA